MVPVHTNFGGNGMLVSSVSLFGGLVLGLMAVSPLRATPLSPVTHTINFDTTAGLTPDSGDFTYNPGSSTFSNFVIHWDGAAFDFTSQANSGIGGNSCGDPTNDPAARFALLAQTLNCGSHTSGGFLFSTNDGGLSA
jgi:hypothetical protein